MIPKIIALLFPIIAVFVLTLIFKFFNIRKYTGIRVIPDLITIILIIGVAHYSVKFTGASLLPYLGFLVSLMAIIILLLDLFVFRQFNSKSFLKLFWRLTFFLTFGMYYGMVLIQLFR